MTTVNYVYGEHKRFFIEGSERHDFPEIGRSVFIHHDLKVITVWHKKFKKNYSHTSYAGYSDSMWKSAYEFELRSTADSVKSHIELEQRLAAQYDAILKDSVVGSIFYSNWGHEQTNIDFYQVVAIKGKKFSFRKIASICEYNHHYMTGKCWPSVDDFKSEEVITKSLSKDAVFKLSSYERLNPAEFVIVDGEKVYEKHFYSTYA